MIKIIQIHFIPTVSSLLLILLTVALASFIKNNFYKKYKKRKEDFFGFENDYNKLLKESEKLLRLNYELKNNLEQTMALYDITKEICRSLDESKVFNLFKQQLDKYIKLSDCKFLNNEAELVNYPDYFVTPLIIEKKPVGFLIAKDILESDFEKFHIMSQQFELGIKRAVLYHRVQELAITDSLTGVLSRRYWMERYKQELERSRKFKLKFSFIMVDIDHFKEINDRYGHLVGDAILKEVSQVIKENLRQIDLVGRYGGEEFSAILIETDKETARFAAERIRQAIEEKIIKVYDEQLKVTISLGVSGFPGDAVEANDLVEKADQALYRAKQSGRNKVLMCGQK